MIDVYLGRQNVFSSALSTKAYEIIYYSSNNGENFIGRNTTSAALSIIQSVLDIGIDSITERKFAFFNLNAQFIKKQKYLPFSEDIAGVMLSAEVDEIDDDLVSAVRRLKNLKYQIVLDLVKINHEIIPLFYEVSGVRIDIANHSRQELRDSLKSLQQFKVKTYAANINDRNLFEFCKSIGFDYFQGDFFVKPEIVQGKRLPSRRLFVLKMLASLHNPDIDIRDLETIIKQDVSLGYKLMRMVNSAYYGLNNQIESIQHALVLLGINPLRAWLSVILLSEIDDQPGPLLSTAIIRGKMCELIAELIPNEDTNSYFLAGLFSILDTLMSIPMGQILESLPMSDAINKALLHRDGPIGTVLDAVIAYEQNNWQAINLPKTSIQQIRETYLKSIAWAGEIMDSNTL